MGNTIDKDSGLTIQRRAFCDIYERNPSAKTATDAVIKSFDINSVKTATEFAARLLSDDKVRTWLSREREDGDLSVIETDVLDPAAMDIKSTRFTRLEQERLIIEMMRVAFFDPDGLYEKDGTLKRVPDMNIDTRAALTGVKHVFKRTHNKDGTRLYEDETIEYKWAGKTTGMEQLGKTLAMFSDKQKLETEAEIEARLSNDILMQGDETFLLLAERIQEDERAGNRDGIEEAEIVDDE